MIKIWTTIGIVSFTLGFTCSMGYDYVNEYIDMKLDEKITTKVNHSMYNVHKTLVEYYNSTMREEKPKNRTVQYMARYILSVNSKVSQEEAEQIGVWILDATKYKKLAWWEILAWMSVESSFDAKCLSDKDAHGLMQVVPYYWVNELFEQGIIKEPKDIDDPRINILCGSYILEKYWSDHRTMATKYYGEDNPRYIGKIRKEISKILNGTF